MRLLSIETSCDETALSIVECEGMFPEATYTLTGNALFSQIDIHAEYGGVFPMVAKREHIKALTPLLIRALTEAKLLAPGSTPHHRADLEALCTHEPELVPELTTLFSTYARPDIDGIAVTSGPGLAPALWVGVNFARALGKTWGVPLIPVNHMEGHILASLFDGSRLTHLSFPALALLISGGHTELVLMPAWKQYFKIGETRDDAVGEAFDKVARMLALPYPGGPHISKHAAHARDISLPQELNLPRPMLQSSDYDFSFSGLKTAVRYGIQNIQMNDTNRAAIARDFEDAVTEVLIAKTLRAYEEHNCHALIIGGGVSANAHLRTELTRQFSSQYPDDTLFFPERHLATDNSVMIALAGHASQSTPDITVNSNWSFPSSPTHTS